MNPIAMTVLLVVLSGLFFRSAVGRYRVLRTGAATQVRADAGLRIPAVVVYVALGVLLLNCVMLWARGYERHFDFGGLLTRHHVVGAALLFAKDALIVAISTRALVALSRAGTRGVAGLVVVWMLAEPLYVGAGLALEAAAAGASVGFSAARPVGSVVGLVLDGADITALTLLQHIGFWCHTGFALVLLNLLPYSRYFEPVARWIAIVDAGSQPTVSAESPAPDTGVAG